MTDGYFAARFNLVLLRQHVKMHELGLRHSKMSVRDLKRLVTQATGNTYGRAAYAEMLEDLDRKIKELEK